MHVTYINTSSDVLVFVLILFGVLFVTIRMFQREQADGWGWILVGAILVVAVLLGAGH